MSSSIEIDASGAGERPTVVVRPAARADQDGFLKQWLDYLQESDLAVSDAVTELAWARIIDPQSGMGALVASAEAGRVVGFAIYVLHPVALGIHPECYLDHIFVEPACRGFGIDRNLILSLGDLARDERWLSLYWEVDEADTAKHIYDDVAEARHSIRYRLSHH